MCECRRGFNGECIQYPIQCGLSPSSTDTLSVTSQNTTVNNTAASVIASITGMFEQRNSGATLANTLEFAVANAASICDENLPGSYCDGDKTW